MNTALHFAFERGHEELVELLLQHGAEKGLGMKNSLGKTPLSLNQSLAKKLGLL